jgi:hypothetical protein
MSIDQRSPEHRGIRTSLPVYVCDGGTPEPQARYEGVSSIWEYHTSHPWAIRAKFVQSTGTPTVWLAGIELMEEAMKSPPGTEVGEGDLRFSTTLPPSLQAEYVQIRIRSTDHEPFTDLLVSQLKLAKFVIAATEILGQIEPSDIVNAELDELLPKLGL